MLCDICNKNPATVHLTEIIDNQMNELHLCEECAHKKSAQMEQQFGLSDLLAGLADFEKPAAGGTGKDDKESVVIKCPNCGLTYKDFKKIGRLGCGDCYTAFRSFLGPLLKRIHGANTHCGKSPVKPAAAGGKVSRRKQPDVQDLRSRLQKAIELEAYEEAARLRDQIRVLEKKQSTGKEPNGKA